MREDEYLRMAQAQDRSWWFCGRRRVLDAVIGRMGLPGTARILDVGCGTGGNLQMLGRHGEVTGLELSAEAVAIAQRVHAGPVFRGGAQDIPDDLAPFDLVTLFDVLEHIDDEAAALHRIREAMAPGGALLVTVPAFMFLWSGHDVALHHRRRYRRAELKACLERCGLTLDWITYYNAGIFPAVAAVRMFRRATGGGEEQADTGEGLGSLGGLFQAIFAAERHVVGRVPMPFGVSLIALARRP